MRRLRPLWVLLLILLLVAGFSMPAQATVPSNGPSTPVLWNPGQTYDLYPALSFTTQRSAGAPFTERYTFTAKANVAKMTVANNGVRELYVTLNGRRLQLNDFFLITTGTVAFDVSSLIQYGDNELSVEVRGKPGSSATITVETPALNVRMLHINDIHAKIDPLPKVAAYVGQARAAEAGRDLLVINGGDNFSGGPVSDLNKGRPMIELLSAMKTDVMAVGNHEFDHGPENTQRRREESPFPWLSANMSVVDPSVTPIRAMEPYRIITNALGQRILFIGLTETPPATAKKNTVGLHFEDPTLVAQAYINALHDQVNLVVLVSHNGLDYDRRMAQQITGADLIIGAHSHTYLPAPVIVNSIPIVQVGNDARWIGDLRIRRAGSVSVSGGAPNGAYTVEVSKLTAVDAETQAIVDRWNAELAPVLDAKLGTTIGALLDQGKYAGDIALGNLITDAMRAYMGTEVAVTNNGGIRASIPAGDITMRNVYTVLPFGNFIVKMNLTGAQIKQALEYAYSRRNQVDLQISGLEYVIYTKPDGSLDHLDLLQNGQPVDLNRTFTIAVQDFLAFGGSGYPFPQFGTPVDQGSDVDAIIVGEYIRQQGTLDYPPSEGRIQIKPAGQ